MQIIYFPEIKNFPRWFTSVVSPNGQIFVLGGSDPQ
jgi:hypothetical protein